MVQVNIDVDISRVKKTIDQALNLETDLDPALHEIGRYMVNSTRANFKRQVDPVTGKPWKPLKPATIAKKGHALILRDTYKMIRATDYQVRKNTVNVFNKDPKSIFHQNGTRFIDQRRFLGASPTNQQRINQIIRRQIKAILNP